MSTVVTYTSDTGQDGSYVGGWDASLDGLTISSGFPPSTVGLVFDLGLRFNGSGVVLDPPIVSAAQLRLTTHPSIVADPGTDTIEVWAVNDPTPANYSDILFPFGRSEIRVGAANYVWGGAGTTLTITLGTYITAGNANTQSCKDNWQTIRALALGSSQWDGKIALSLQNVTGGFVFAFNSSESTGTSPELLLTQTPFFAGLTGGPVGPRARFVRDGRFGMPALNTELVQDQYNPALYVRSFDQDPEDPPNRYRPRRGEGSVDDDIPDL